MKVTAEPLTAANPTDEFLLPQGLVGFPEYDRFSVIFQEEQLPFCWLRLMGAEDELHFVVVEPGNVLPDYEPELFDEDAAYLELTEPSWFLDRQRPSRGVSAGVSAAGDGNGVVLGSCSRVGVTSG